MNEKIVFLWQNLFGCLLREIEKKFYVYTKNKKLQNTFKNFRSAKLKVRVCTFSFSFKVYIWEKDLTPSQQTNKKNAKHLENMIWFGVTISAFVMKYFSKFIDQKHNSGNKNTKNANK